VNSLPKEPAKQEQIAAKEVRPDIDSAMNKVTTSGENSPQSIDSTEESAKLSRIITEVFDAERPSTTIGKLLEELDHHGLAMALIFFSIPAAIPVPAAGYSTVLAIPLFILGYHLLAGKDSLWLPEKIKAKSFTPGDFTKGKALMLKISGLVELISKPRFTKIVRSRAISLVLGVVILILAAFMSMPIPGTNTLPAGGIFLIGFGLLEEDGLILLGGILYSLCAALFATMVIFLGKELAKQAFLSILDLF
jgi:hypothetical protein